MTQGRLFAAALALAAAAGVLLTTLRTARQQRPAAAASAPAPVERAGQRYRGRLGPHSEKIRRRGGKTLLWAGAAPPQSPRARWYDFSGAPIPAAELQFGIGRDRIRSIDDPLFVDPDDPRLGELPASPYRRHGRPSTNDQIMVIGYARGGEARAYPLALLERHELVNDRVGGKPVTVGW